MRKKLLIISCTLLIAVVWIIRFYSVNGRFKAYRDNVEEIIYNMNEYVELGDNLTYGCFIHKGYSVLVKKARVLEADDFLKEIGKLPNDFNIEIADKYIEVTLDIINSGNNEEGLLFYSFQISGIDWYTFFNHEETAFSNDFMNDNVEQSYGVIVNKNSSAEVKIIYPLYTWMLPTSRWEQIKKEKLFFCITRNPIEQKVLLEFD